MLRVSGMLGSSGDGPAAAEGGAGPSSGEDERMKFEDSERNSGGGGNRWPRQETLALLKIRSDMDSAFRDSSLKGPLWDEVSRKLAELGYHRNAKKCKEKFENVYKYHKRTKDGRSTKSEGKTYRFFDQLEALDQTQPSSQFPPPPQPQRSQNQGPESPTPVAMAMPTSIHRQIFPQVTIASTSIVPTNASHSLKSPITLPLSDPSPPTQPPPVPATNATVMPNDTNTRGMMNNTNAAPSHGLNQNLNTNFECDLGSSSPSSSEGEEDPERGRTKRKRKWESFFQKLMSEVIQKQEQMQKDFLKALERRERERVAREEAWRAQEMARMNREHELLAQERSIAAAKDSAVIAYLQKISDLNQQTPTQIRTQTKMQTPTLQGKESSTPNPDSALVPIPTPNPNVVQMPAPPLPQPPPPQQLQIQPYDNARNGNHVGGASSSRWPKAEVQALIQLRTNMDIKYQDNGPKGPLWEEISGEMKKIGYDRNAKRCKEKWENINKYFKKVKESNKKRPEDSKTCPYFHLLDQIYRERAKVGGGGNSMAPMMVKPEQQWPQLLDRESDEMDGEDEEEEEEGGGYEIVTNKVQGAAESGSDVGGDGYAVGVRATWGPVVAEQMDTVKHMGGCV